MREKFEGVRLDKKTSSNTLLQVKNKQNFNNYLKTDVIRQMTYDDYEFHDDYFNCRLVKIVNNEFLLVKIRGVKIKIKESRCPLTRWGRKFQRRIST